MLHHDVLLQGVAVLLVAEPKTRNKLDWKIFVCKFASSKLEREV